MNNLSDLNWTFEITRRCRCKCDHCCRGNAQNKEMDKYMFNHMLNKLEPSSIHLTGGEPFLHKQIDSILQSIQTSKSIGILSVITSANIPLNSIGQLVNRLSWIKQGHIELSLQLSKDNYHPNNNSIYELHELLEQYGIDCYPYNSTYTKEPMGFGKSYEYQLGFRNAEDSCYPFKHEYFNGSVIMVNVYGDIYPGCEWSYAAQKRFKDKVCLGNLYSDSIETINLNYKKFVGKNGVKMIYSEMNVELIKL